MIPITSFGELKLPICNKVAINIKTIPIIKKPRGRPIYIASFDPKPILFWTKLLLKAKLNPKNPPNKIKKT